MEPQVEAAVTDPMNAIEDSHSIHHITVYQEVRSSNPQKKDSCALFGSYLYLRRLWNHVRRCFVTAKPFWSARAPAPLWTKTLHN
jgi:hypothetical protein